MKSTFQIVAAAVCAAALTACGGAGTDKTPVAAVIVQPAYKVTETLVGTGAVAAAGDLVTINMVGYLYDATKADFKGAKVESSVDTGKPAAPFTLGVGNVVTGWDQTIIGMKIGGKRTAILPANMAYGTNSRVEVKANGITYPAIPANSPLVYDFELVDVTKGIIPVVVPPPTTLTSVDVVIGSGTAAASGKNLSVYYTLYLYDGTKPSLRGNKIESNVGGATFDFVLGSGKVIQGWEQGLVGMLAGGTRTLTIPPSLAYGSTQQNNIPPNSTLIFDIQLVTVK
ncbi:FKBP-type peptidyl-prolyl cis-trans isomerase [Pseudoduganella danionis]|uniref:Peptidyl-prolyl cis-trans isomerase n=1 Tax=Pseudoduganella danionis TaxID=1890295 RepID=A0ABW9SQ65_9BURK|nr:FKBP-type peptidyl-prolyl cis-trans isomerase [Pseudoduganella danionis]MTW34162.1 FKBP-type peptidylprolyl isomerase [Pseudoduganella danionis]